MTSLLDILKETDLRVNFTDNFKNVGQREILTREELRRRLLIIFYGLGTNTGLKRVNTDRSDINYKNLLYVKQKYITKDYLIKAISEVANEVFKVRQFAIWGNASTSCASDSKQFGSWDQNIITEWHNRYHGRGIMIYWHVEKNSVCIYSQLKTCSSSEVASMIEGVIRHCTEMNVDKNYVDTHGQNVVAFAFSHMLNFNLMPRLKNIHSQKLYTPNLEIKSKLNNLFLILGKNSINWKLIEEQYDQIIKYTIAILTGTAETEAILKRFTRYNQKHPTYLALCELGKVIKTIFLCNYLSSKKLRTEIHEGLNVVENWNSANNFIFFGKGHIFATNNIVDQEISMLCLHLLQNCLIYINTIMIQNILKKDEWYNKFEEEDFRSITPLIYEHINPYGNFRLDMKKRLNLENIA